MNLFCLILSLLIAITHGDKQATFFQWKALRFGFTPEDMVIYKSSVNGTTPTTYAIPVDVQPYYDRKGLRLFVTIPKAIPGIPYSLATVLNSKTLEGPKIRPYPSFKDHNHETKQNCDDITSAVRVAIDDCNRLWVIDSGVEYKVARCEPQLLAFNLTTDKLVYRHRFNKTLYKPYSLLSAPILSAKDPLDCNNLMVYIPDSTNNGLIVVDIKRDVSWRIEHKSMTPEPKYMVSSVAGEKFTLTNGIFGVATDNKNLYYHGLASLTEYAVPLQVIDDSVLAANNGSGISDHFRRLGERNGICTSSAMDSEGNLYCVTLNPIQLLQWNVHTPFDSNNTKSMPINEKDLEFVSGIKVVRNNYGQKELWMMSNRYQKTVTQTMNYTEPNYRIVVHLFDDHRNEQQKSSSSMTYLVKFSISYSIYDRHKYILTRFYPQFRSLK